MDNYPLIELLQQELKALAPDIRAESLLALAMNFGLSQDDFMVSNDSLFVREHSKDIVSAEVKEDAKNQSFLQLHLSRAGIYDQLPEGLFYQPRERKGRGISAATMAADYKVDKKKEAQIRRFFLPIENDLFLQRIRLEAEEGKLLEGLQSGILNDYFVDFWNIPRTIPRSFVAPLILFLPYAYQIAGDMQLTAECLEQLLLETVQTRLKRSSTSQAGDLLGSLLGESTLGVDMLCGEKFEEDCPVVEFVIGPLQRSKLTDYLEGGDRAELLEIFGKFFVPAGLDTEFKIMLPEENQQMIMKKNDGPVLGYSSII